MKLTHRLIGGILLVTGTTVGAGMLALPVVTGLAGFIPSIFLFITMWLYMTFTALLILEINLWMGENTNIISMAKKTLGKWGAAISWVIYLFLLYSLTTAYMAGSGPIFLRFFHNMGLMLPEWTSSFPLFVLFGIFVYMGTRSVDYVNQFLNSKLYSSSSPGTSSASSSSSSSSAT